jgi:heptosyltransferase-3
VIKRILIVRTDRLGDLVATLPMVTAIKQHLPEAKVVLMVREYTAPLLELTREVDEVLLFDPNFSLKRKIQLFASAKVDVAFFPSPKPDLASAAAFARIERRVGTGYRWYSPLFTDKIYDHRKTAEFHESDYNVRMLSAIGIPNVTTPLPKLSLNEVQLNDRDELLNGLLEHSSMPYAVIHVGTGGSSKEWPTANFVQLGARVAQRLSLPIILTGTEAERERILSIRDTLHGFGTEARVFAGHSLTGLAEILSGAAIVIAGSTGPGHLAAALGTPTVGIFPLARALSKERWGFRGPNVINLSPGENLNVSCPMCQNCTCIAQISIAEVLTAVERVMSF